jgi:hypothetical protein
MSFVTPVLNSCIQTVFTFKLVLLGPVKDARIS